MSRGLKPEMNRMLAWAAGAAMAVVLALSGSARANDACDRLLRQWIDEGKAAHLTEAQYNAPLERLGELQRVGGQTVVAAIDAVFKAADPGAAPKLMEQFLARRTPEEARKLFEVGAAFSEERARRGLARAAGMAPFQSVEAGTSAYEFVSKAVIAPGAKEQFFRGLDAISSDPGASRLLKRAGQANNYGAVFEVAADAKLVETGRYGRLAGVDFDLSGDNVAFRLVDTVTEMTDGSRYAFQSKSSYNQARDLVLDGDISAEDLDALADQARALGARPVLMSNVGFDQALVDACSAKGIIMEPNWVRVIE